MGKVIGVSRGGGGGQGVYLSLHWCFIDDYSLCIALEWLLCISVNEPHFHSEPSLSVASWYHKSHEL